MGIRKKIFLAFLCLSLMLLFSGMISLFELNRMSRATRGLLDYNTRSMELARVMLDAAQEQNTSLLQMIVLDQETFDSSFVSARTLFSEALEESSFETSGTQQLQKIGNAKRDYDYLIDNYLRNRESLDVEWFVETYSTSYFNLTSSVKDYMTWSQYSLSRRASQLKNNAYRAIMPGILTLVVAIIMIFVFAYLLDYYYTRPMLAVSRGIRNFLRNKTPFYVKLEGRDEIRTLKENIDELITICKNKKSE